MSKQLKEEKEILQKYNTKTNRNNKNNVFECRRGNKTSRYGGKPKIKQGEWKILRLRGGARMYTKKRVQSLTKKKQKAKRNKENRHRT